MTALQSQRAIDAVNARLRERAERAAECREYGHDWRGYEGERSEHGHVCGHCGETR